MHFRFKAFAVHLASSALALTLILGGLYLGWYRWPGWYLADAAKVLMVMVGVDVVLGPLLTLVIANPGKPRRELTRDVGVIVAVQIIALVYGATQLWQGRPLYYAYSEGLLQLVQAYDISPDEAALGRRSNPTLAPHAYALPRWVWAPLPSDPAIRAKIMQQAIGGGDDVIDMPRYYRPWADGAADLRAQLAPIMQVKKYVSSAARDRVRAKMRAAGLPTDVANAIPLVGRGKPLIAVFEPSRLELLATFEVY